MIGTRWSCRRSQRAVYRTVPLLAVAIIMFLAAPVQCADAPRTSRTEAAERPVIRAAANHGLWHRFRSWWRKVRRKRSRSLQVPAAEPRRRGSVRQADTQPLTQPRDRSRATAMRTRRGRSLVPEAGDPEAVSPAKQSRDAGIRQAEYVLPEDDLPVAQSVEITATNVEIACLGPQIASAGDVFVQRVVVRNAGQDPLEEAVVEARFSGPVEILNPGPDCKAVDSGVLWQVPRLKPGAQQELRLIVRPLAAGPLRCTARLSSTTVAETVTEVRSVRLAASLDGPRLVAHGDRIELVLKVRNEGNAVARGVVVRHVPEGPQAASHEGASRFELAVGDVPPGTERTVRVPVLVMKGGRIRLKLQAVAQGGQMAEAVYEAKVRAPVLVAKLSGPARWLPGRSAALTVRVVNRGDVAAEDAELLLYLAPGIRIAKLPEGARANRTLRTVTVPIGQLPVGGSWQASLELVPEVPGTRLVRCCVVAANGAVTKIDYRVRARGVAALNVEIKEAHDPVMVGETTRYVVIVTNTGTADARDVSVACRWRGALQVERVHGGSLALDSTGRFLEDLVSVLRPGESARYVIEGVVTDGESIEIRAEARSVSCPVVARDEESTTAVR